MPKPTTAVRVTTCSAVSVLMIEEYSKVTTPQGTPRVSVVVWWAWWSYGSNGDQFSTVRSTMLRANFKVQIMENIESHLLFKNLKVFLRISKLSVAAQVASQWPNALLRHLLVCGLNFSSYSQDSWTWANDIMLVRNYIFIAQIAIFQTF